MKHLVYFHRNRRAGYSINKVTQTVIRGIEDKEEYELPGLGPSPFTVLKNLWFVYRHRRKDSINHVTGDVQYAMAPVWILTTRYQDKPFTFVMNGQTGKLVGELPVDENKAKMYGAAAWLITLPITYFICKWIVLIITEAMMD